MIRTVSVLTKNPLRHFSGALVSFRILVDELIAAWMNCVMNKSFTPRS